MFKDLKLETKNTIRNSNYLTMCFDNATSMFEYNLPKTINTHHMEEIALKDGMAAIAKYGDGNWYECHVAGIGPMLPNLTYEKYRCSFICGNYDSTANVECIDGVDCFVFYNTPLHSSFFTFFDRYSNILSEIDSSIYATTMRSRLAPIIFCSDKELRTQIENIMKAIENGNYKPISNTKLNLYTGVSDPLKIVDINECQNIQTVQYLSEEHDAIIRRLYRLFGMNIFGTSKKAQVTTDEVAGNEAISWILPVTMLNERKKLIEKIKTVFPEASVDFSKVFKKVFDSFICEEVDVDDNRRNPENTGDTDNNSRVEDKSE